VSAPASARCSDLSRGAGEVLAATASTTERWILVEVPGPWPRDVSTPGPLPQAVHAALERWVAAAPRSRVLFVRRPGPARGRPPQVFAMRSDETAKEVRRIGVERLEDLADADLDSDGERLDASLVLVCGHGSRDRCCALRGTAVFDALRRELPHAHLWISSHQGGHRFAGNVLVLPAGIQLGRVDANAAASMTADALSGRIDLAHYRGRTYYDGRVQAAEHAVREATGLLGADDLSLASVDGSIVRLRERDGAVHAVAVEEAEGPAVPASCGAPPEPHGAFSVRLL
jgi:hypothetical protein